MHLGKQARMPLSSIFSRAPALTTHYDADAFFPKPSLGMLLEDQSPMWWVRKSL